MMQSWSYFPSIVYRDELPQWADTIHNSTENLYNTARQKHNFNIPMPLNTTAVWECSQAASAIQPFVNHLNTLSVEILNSQGYDTSLYNIGVDALWGQELSYGAQQPVHVHSNTVLSGVYIITQPDENSSSLIFEDPRPGKLMSDMFMVEHEEILAGESSIIFNNLVKGTLMVFNSFLPHKFTPHYSNNSLKFLHFCVTSTPKRA